MPPAAGSGKLVAGQPMLYVALVLGFVALFAGTLLRATRDGPTAEDYAETTFGDHAKGIVVWHAYFGFAALVAAMGADMPFRALGLVPGTDSVSVGVGVGLLAIVVGLLLDVGLDRLGVPDVPHREARERLRTPQTAPQWLLHVSAVVPVRVLGTELLLRGAVVGGLGVALDLHPASLVVVSAMCQVALVTSTGVRAMLVGAVIGGLLAGAFLVSGSLLASVLALLLLHTHDTVDNVRQYGIGRHRSTDWVE